MLKNGEAFTFAAKGSYRCVATSQSCAFDVANVLLVGEDGAFARKSKMKLDAVRFLCLRRRVCPCKVLLIFFGSLGRHKNASILRPN